MGVGPVGVIERAERPFSCPSGPWGKIGPVAEDPKGGIIGLDGQDIGEETLATGSAALGATEAGRGQPGIGQGKAGLGRVAEGRCGGLDILVDGVEGLEGLHEG